MDTEKVRKELESRFGVLKVMVDRYPNRVSGYYSDNEQSMANRLAGFVECINSLEIDIDTKEVVAYLKQFRINILQRKEQIK